MCRPADFPPFDDPARVATRLGALTLLPAPVAFNGGPASCLCGARTYATYDAAREAEPTGAFKCPACRTFATDHACRCDENSDFRCIDCDIRHGSHGAPDGR